MFHLGGRKKPAFGSLEVRRVSGYRKHAQSKRNLRKSMKLILNIYIYIYISKFLLWGKHFEDGSCCYSEFPFQGIVFPIPQEEPPGQTHLQSSGTNFCRCVSQSLPPLRCRARGAWSRLRPHQQHGVFWLAYMLPMGTRVFHRVSNIKDTCAVLCNLSVNQHTQ